MATLWACVLEHGRRLRRHPDRALAVLLLLVWMAVLAGQPGAASRHGRVPGQGVQQPAAFDEDEVFED